MAIIFESYRGLSRFLVSILLFASSFFITGFEEGYSVSMTDDSDPYHPIFCVSRLDDCRGVSRNIGMFDVERVYKSGEHAEYVWIVSSRSNEPVAYFQYGTIPDGWIEYKPPNPLIPGKFYCAQGLLYFTLRDDSGQITIETYTWEEFLDLE